MKQCALRERLQESVKQKELNNRLGNATVDIADFMKILLFLFYIVSNLIFFFPQSKTQVMDLNAPS